MFSTRLSISTLQPHVRTRTCAVRRSQTAGAIRAELNGNTYDPVLPVGERLQNLLKSPFDLLALGPRAAAGAMQVFPELAANFQTDLDNLNMLVQDPRPLEEKQKVVAEEIETRLVDILERGVKVERDLFAQIKPFIPADLQPLIPQELQSAIDAASVAAAEEEQRIQEEEDKAVYTNFSSSAIAASQAAAEMVEIKERVTILKEAITSLRTNVDSSQIAMLRLNLKESKDSLVRILRQINPSTLNVSDVPLQAAVEEANQLVAEVDTMLV